MGAENAWVLCRAFVVQTAAGDCLNVHSLLVATENAQQYQGMQIYADDFLSIIRKKYILQK